MLTQQNIRDTDDKLIAPWDAQVALHPGALVAVKVTLIVYNFCSLSTTSTVCLFKFLYFTVKLTTAQVFQVQGRRIQILERSPLLPEPSPLPLEESASPVEEATTRTASTSHETQLPSKSSLPSDQEPAAKRPNQTAGPSLASVSASTSSASTSPATAPNQLASSRSARRQAANAKK